MVSMATDTVCPKCGGVGFVIVEGAHVSSAKRCDCASQGRAGRMENGAEPSRGMGLSNTRARLEQLYGGSHSFAIADCDGGGVAVRINLPLSDNQAAAPASKA